MAPVVKVCSTLYLIDAGGQINSKYNKTLYFLFGLYWLVCRFSELCAVVGAAQQSCYQPDRKLIEKSFRRAALKCHPDKGGDPVVFKRLNDAYLRLISHIQKVFIDNSYKHISRYVDNFASLELLRLVC